MNIQSKNQLKYSKYDHKDNKNYPEPNVLRLYEKPLTQIYNEKDGESFAKYIASVLDKLFPHPNLMIKLDQTKNTDCMTSSILVVVTQDLTNTQVIIDHQTNWEDLLPESDRRKYPCL